MRILMISDVYFPRVNGVSTSIQSFRRQLQAMGHQVTLIVPEYPAAYDDDEQTIRISSRYVPLDPEDRMLKKRKLLALTEQLRAEQFDLIHIHTPFVAHYAGLTLAKRLGLPVVVSYHTFFEEYLYNYIPFLPKRSLRWVARHFSASQCNQVQQVIVPSRPIAERLLEYGIQTPQVRVPTGIDLQQFREGDGNRFRQRHGIDEDRPVMVYIGRIAHEKNIDFLLQVAKRVREEIPELLFVIAGEGPALGHLKGRVKALELQQNVQFVGYLKRDGELQDCYRAGDVMTFASRTETQGLVLLEALSLGVPVVSTAVLGTKDVLAPHCGALISSEDVQCFANLVIKVINSRKLSDELSRQGPEYCKQWSQQACAERLLAAYQQMVATELESAAQVDMA